MILWKSSFITLCWFYTFNIPNVAQLHFRNDSSQAPKISDDPSFCPTIWDGILTWWVVAKGSEVSVGWQLHLQAPESKQHAWWDVPRRLPWEAGCVAKCCKPGFTKPQGTRNCQHSQKGKPYQKRIFLGRIVDGQTNWGLAHRYLWRDSSWNRLR